MYDHCGYYETTFITPPFLDIKSLMRLGNGIRFVSMTFLVIHIMVTLTLLLLIVFSKIFYMEKLDESYSYD